MIEHAQYESLGKGFGSVGNAEVIKIPFTGFLNITELYLNKLKYEVISHTIHPARS